METAFAWIHHRDYRAIVVRLMLGSVGLPIPDEPLLMCVGYLSSKGLSAPLSTALCKEVYQCLNV
jgi:membrane protein DedA with SNARE-associated domain